jgi:GH15 family glucan-1,4-alpha-glucosidase
MGNDIHRYEMGVIGNCSYLAYIDTSASVQWLCMPRFDSGCLFGGLLDKEKCGEFSVAPSVGMNSSRQFYRTNTNILVTEINADDGIFRVTDFAPRFFQYDRYFRPLMLVRKIEPQVGEPLVKVVCRPRGAYGATVPETVMASNHLRFLNLESQVRLTTDIPLTNILEEKPFVLSGSKYCVLTYGEPLEAPLESTVEQFLEKTERYWTQWVKSTSIPLIYQKEVIRSALALKIHQYEDTGAIIASGSTSLPESHQSGRNWDYRYCWIRDAFYTLNAFNSIGHFEELERYFHFIRNAIQDESAAIQPVYGLGGEKTLLERELPLNGYRNNRPVRVGNDAHLQLQFDVYGQLLAGLLPLYTDLRLDNDFHRGQTRLIVNLLARIEKTMDLPDAGIWEFRNRKQRHCYTALSHWAGCKAAFKIACHQHDDALADKAFSLSRRSEEIIERCFSPVRQAYTQAIGVPHLDASSLQLITMNYLDPASPKAHAHLNALEKELLQPHGLLLRYSHEDDFGVPSTSFLVCSFWYCEALASAGRIDDARRTLELLLRCSNHLGLFSEDADESFGQWGNFPQTYSHVGLINAVYRIANKQETPQFLF